ncbi:MAG: TspO/MBR family protein [Ruminococcus sp.]|jgi:tryptophan-rich sensory protein|nr:TspO/MBR family protein [Ruminococcus sp.]
MTLVHSIDYKKLGISCAISLGIGALSGIVSAFGMSNFDNAAKPPLTPPSWLFPIVWTILFLLMGISSYIIFTSHDCDPDLKNTALTIYAAQLVINFFWPVIFFNLSAYLLAFIWIVLLLVMIIVMYRLFYRINKLSAYLQIPYLIWVSFATYLTFGVFIVN